MFFKKIVLLLACCALLLPSYKTEVQSQTAQGLAVSPAIVEVEAEPGKTYNLEYLVENNTGIDNLTVDVTIETFGEGSIEGSANVVPFLAENDISYWLTVPTPQTYTQQAKQNNIYQLSIPPATSPGAYFFAIVYQPQLAQNQANLNNSLQLKTRIATLLFVNIGGDILKQPQINNYTLSNTWVDPVFDRLDIGYDIKIVGNSFYRPAGNIFLSDGSDAIIILSSFVSDKLLLPNSTRSFASCIDSPVALVSPCQGKKLENSLPLWGEKTITIRLDYNDGEGNPKSIAAEKKITIFPYKTILAVLAVLILLYLLYRLLTVFRKKKYASIKK